MVKGCCCRSTGQLFACIKIRNIKKVVIESPKRIEYNQNYEITKRGSAYEINDRIYLYRT